ncbi:nicotinate-nucleotide--dimethylbenzimidazole phosphoribosyltransferase [uncultured Desulfuromonas sp.]|uniref:nicotinate-nucleotide--dimethylbenzimidazole phosphoribosyltransferase n=1 Tax=uncultured Desulfuromonas sp. TaxID=181013 RepID=UPI002AAA827C|nr:nicotinate-nucleotide--dimethylbenzimidazole phosphoribosyltransferase [uncultured Desulfuromonas sp.]
MTPNTLLTQTLTAITPADSTMRQQARARLDQLAIPHGALGQLMDVAEDLAAITRTMTPSVKRKAIAVMAGDHGIVAAGVSKFPQAVTVEMVRNFLNGNASINALARQVDASLTVVDAGVAGDLTELYQHNALWNRKVAPGTADFSQGPAMSRAQAVQCLEVGIEVANHLADTTDLYATGDMGIGNTSPSSAIIACLCGCDIATATGRGTGLDDEALNNKIAVLDNALAINQPNADDGLDVLTKVGGFEIGAIAGLILGAAALRKPVVIDGIISTAGALIAASLSPACRDYMIAGHCSVEPGHRIALNHLDKAPLLDLRLRLGEGTGAALAMNLVDAAVAVLTEIATFEEAAISQADTTVITPHCQESTTP